MMVPPGTQRAGASAASTMAAAMRSLIEPPGLRAFGLHADVMGVPNSRLMRMCGVLPMVCEDVVGEPGGLRLATSTGGRGQPRL